MYALTLVLAWHLTWAVAGLDSHPTNVDTMGGQIHLTGFTSRSACMAHEFSMPVALNGTPQPYTETSKTCRTRRRTAPRRRSSASNRARAALSAIGYVSIALTASQQ